MDELKAIIQRMVDAGESEENIKLVIERYQGKVQGSTVDPTMSQNDMGSQLDDGSLEPKEELSDSEQFRNVFKNAKLSLQEAWESSKIAGAQFGSYLGVGDEEETDKYIVDQYKKLDKISAKMGDTGKGIVRGVKEGDIADIGIGVVNALTSVITTVAPAIATRGLSLVPQIMAPMYTEYNSEKAKALYGDDEERAIEKLIANNEDEVAVPMALGAASVALERIGIKGISSYVLNKARTKGAKRIANLTLTGHREGLTEYFQGGLNVANKSLAQGDDAGTVSKKVFDHMSSEAALEEYVQGFVGGAGISAGGAKINSAFRDKNDNIIVNDYINALGVLNQQKVSSKTEDAKNAIDKKIKKVEQNFRDFLITNQKKSEYLTEEQATEAINILDTKKELNDKVQKINNQLNNNEISKNEHDLILQDIQSEFDANDKKLNDIKIEANKKLLHDDLRVSSEAISKIRGLSQKVYKTPEGFLKALNARSKKQYTLKDVENVDGLIVGKDILINETVAAETNAITVGSHELLHAIVKSSITGEIRKVKDVDGKTVETDLTVEGAALIKDFLNELSSKEKKIVQKRIDDNYRYNRNKKGEIVSEKAFEQYAEEYLNAYADAAIKNELSDSLLDKLGKFLQKIFNKGDKGYQDLNFKTGEDVKTFLKAYVSDRKKGQFRQQFIDMAQEGVKQKTKTTIVKKSSTVNLDKGEGDISQKIDALTQGAKTKAEFQKPGGAFDNIYSGMLEGKFDRIFGEGISLEQKEIQRQNLADRLMNYDPAKTPELSKWIYGGSGKAGNVVYSGLVAKKKLFEEGERKKRTTRIDDPDVKDIPDDTPTLTETTKVDQKDVKLRKLKDFNVELDNGLADALTIEEVNSLLDSYVAGKITFEQAKAKMEELVAKDIRSELSKSIPKIAKDKKTGKRGPTPEYESWVRDQYDEVVSSLGIRVIRDAYRPWFKKEKVRTEKYKNIDPVTGKVSNFVKDVFENTTNKREYIRWFLEGKPGVLTERRTALIRRISKRKASLAVDNYIAENSDSIDAKMLSFMNTLSDSAENAINEQVSFDSVKFSKSLKKNDNRINKAMEKNGYYKAPDGTILTFAKRKDGTWDKGRVFEQAMTETLQEILKNVKNVSVASEVATEEGGRADLIIEYDDGSKLKIENHEIKKGLSAFMGSVLISELNLKNGKFTLANPIHNDIKGLNEFMKKIVKNLSEKVKVINSEINIYNKKYGYKKGDKEFAEQITGNAINRKPESMPLEVYNKIGKELGVLKAGVEIIANHYKGKTIKVDGKKIQSPVKSISLFGYGSFRIDPTSIFSGLEMLDVNTEVYASIRYGKKTKKGSKDFVTFKPGLQFRLDGKPKNKSNSGLYTEEAIVRALNTVAYSKNTGKTRVLNNAVKMSRSTKKESKGITVLDFDDTLATTKSLVRFTAPDGTTGTLNAEEYASTYQDLLEQGYTFDFSEFNKVVKGKIAPLFQKALKLQGKFGPENMFVLTARPPAAQKAIFDFLKANGLNIPLKNITGLGNSTSEAKALWIADKVGEGYNDFYFADDALQNVQAVKNMLDQFDVKSKVQQAKVKFSKNMNNDFNNILEDVTGIESKKRFSAIKARKRGADKGKFRFFIPPSHEDFVGLLYNFMGKGKEGNAHRDFFEKALIRPLNRAYRELNAAKQSIANDYKSLNKQFAEVKKKLIKKTPDGDFTYQDAVRIYLWDKHGHDIPGLSPTDQQNLVDLVMGDPELQAYAETLNIISKQDKYIAPNESWEGGDIRTDLDDATGRIGRKEFFTEFNENTDIIFSQENLNKIEAAYGADVVSAIKDMLYRIQTGQNRPSGQNALVNKFLNYLNGSVASTMFFNIRSAVLQQMSMVNFINFADNNVFAAAKAFANQKQYWTDWATIFNSDFMKQRRKGIQTDVNGAELAASVKKAKNPIQAAIKKLLELGFLPTQIGDNIAIATGGATFLRNRINTYLKEGLSQKEAEAKAFVDFEILAEATQQSARPDMVSQQQASPLGKVILAFQNVTSQFNRLGKKAFLDIKNRRITPGNQTQLQSDMSNLSRIAYYLAIQNLIFYSLQSALFMMMFDDDEDDEKFLKKKERMINGSIDSVLRGTGVWGSAIATLKNMAIKWHEQRDKGYNADESAVLMEMLNVSPPLGIKARKLVNAEKTLNYNKKNIEEMETFDIDNPQWSAYTNYIESTTNVPLNRLYNKTMNVRESLNNQHSAFERALLFGGWSKWNLGIEDVEKSKKKQDWTVPKPTKHRNRTGNTSTNSNNKQTPVRRRRR